MSQQRTNAYLQLIETLLNCPNGQEPEVLNAYPELIDEGLVQAMAQVAKVLEQKGDRNSANWLRNLAVNLLEMINNSSSATTPEAYFNFLLEVLQALVQSNRNRQFLYQLFQANLDKLDDNFAQALRNLGARLPKVEPEKAQIMANVIMDCSALIDRFPMGDSASKLEIFIAGYEVAATLLTREVFPKDWAIIQYNLGLAYSDPIRGDQAENCETAIKCFLAALQIDTSKDFPEEWGNTLYNLGNLYNKRSLGERAGNLEECIKYYSNALNVFTHETFPIKWAMTQNKLGNRYRNRILGERTENLEATIECYLAALEVYTREAFPEKWAEIQNNLGVIYTKRTLGEKAENLEAAIKCYLAALEVITQADPENWVNTQLNLGAVYSDRIHGKKAENLEAAIRCFEAALEVRTREVFPQEWAKLQNNLGIVYSHMREERAENLEKAIHCFQAILEVCTREAFPEEWAMAQSSLGSTYDQRILGELAENLEAAINYHLAALEIYTREAFPFDWARSQHNLGNTYSDRIYGERAENLEAAIKCHLAALEVRTPEASPVEWANTQTCLGAVYRVRIRGEKAENLEAAIKCYLAALEVRTPEAFPEQWAETKHNLGNAYRDRILGKPSENLEEAIRCFKAVLQIYTCEAFSERWAMTQNCLGGTYIKRTEGNRAENLEAAISCFSDALEVYTPSTFPNEWATTQNNLGGAYGNRIRGERTDNLKAAIKCYLAALNVHTHEAFPQYYAETQKNLGFAYQAALEFPDAYNAFAAAIDTVESLRGEIVKGSGREDDKQKLAEEWNSLYQSMVEVCIMLGYLDQAVEYVERSKARNLVELLANRDVYPKGNVPPETIAKLDCLRREIPAVQRQLEDFDGTRNIASLRTLNGETLARNQPPLGDSTASNSTRNKLNNLQQELTEVLEQINNFDRNFNLTQEVKAIQFSDIQALLNDRTAILKWYITDQLFYTFLITHNNPQPIPWYSPITDREELEKWAENYRHSYTKQKAQWLSELNNQLAELSTILHIDEIVARIPRHITQLILIPHRWLHLFPLHALPVGDAVVLKRQSLAQNSELDDRPPDGYRLLDCFPDGVRYAPSCQLLQLAQKRDRPEFSHLFAIANPTKDRYLLELQSANIRYRFKSNDFLAKDDANKRAIQNQQLSLANCVHFGCHGKFEPDSPLESALILANKERLTLLEILALNLSQCRLVTLSACETGLTESSTTDEYIGLPFGFLLAGSPSMVSSLWEVDQLATTLLLIRFFENLETLSTVTALNEAQQWLRKLDSAKLDTELKRLKPQITQIFDQLPKKEHRLYIDAPQNGARNRKPFPFAEPRYWAGFTAIGV
ncbi:CHAT domain-containing protein [Coleofasciculus sp. FACHB-64]|uniref:CHAT domain-containing protein n=1 Tax=Cyanophyceae TaxID=3028117 RepID=UPI001684A61A|nr:CHAT domain-containing protein [Coleofasciculus sp. FACHB-64]